MAASFARKVAEEHGSWEDSLPSDSKATESDLPETIPPEVVSSQRNDHSSKENDEMATVPDTSEGVDATLATQGNDLENAMPTQDSALAVLDQQIAEDLQNLNKTETDVQPGGSFSKAEVSAEEGGTDPGVNAPQQNAEEKTSDNNNGNPETKVCCCKCGLEREISRCTRKSKKFVCFSCNSAASLLSRAISGGLTGGTNTAAEFKSLPEAEQQQFWRDAAGASRQQLATQYTSKLSASKEKEESEGTQGFFRPLSYWETQGFDSKAIEEKTLPQDRRQHPVLGEVFRVHLDYSEDKTSKKLKEEREAAGSAEHGLAQEPKTAPAPKSDRKTAKQKEKDEAKTVAANGKIMAAATKVIAALSSTITKERPYMAARGDNPTEEDAIELQKLWADLCKIYSDASQLVETYKKNPKQKLPEESLPPLSVAKSTNKQFLAQVKVVRGNKRKNAD